MGKQSFILTPDMLHVLGDDVSSERKNAIVNALTNNWAFIIYPESMPSNWLDILESYYIPFAVSPLHDKDINADGTPKKPHYHILLTSESKKSFSQLFEISSQLNGSYLINVGNVRGYYRYLCHLDNPEKFQYSQELVRHCVGFNPDSYTKANSSERYLLIRQMLNFIRENNILDYVDFCDYCCFNQYDWFKLLCDNSSVFISKYIDSKRKKYFQTLSTGNNSVDYV